MQMAFTCKSNLLVLHVSTSIKHVMKKTIFTSLVLLIVLGVTAQVDIEIDFSDDQPSVGDLMEEQLKYIMEDQMVRDLLKE